MVSPFLDPWNRRASPWGAPSTFLANLRQVPGVTTTTTATNDGERAGGSLAAWGASSPWDYAKQEQTTPTPTLVNATTGGAGGTPSATGWQDTSAQQQSVAPPGATGVFANDQWVNEAGSRYEYGDTTQAGGKARAGTALAKGAIKTWVNYDGSRDTQLHERGETSWRRVNRWTQEGVAEHGLTPQEAHNAALARLKRDFEISKLDWRTSGYDLSNVQAAPPGQDWAKANAVGAAPGTTPGTTPATTPATTPTTTPATSPTTPATTTPTAPPTTTPTTATNASGTSTAYSAALAANKAQRMARLYELLGIGNPSSRRSFGGQALSKQADNFDAWNTATQGLGGEMVNDDVEGSLAKFAGYLRGQGGFGKIRDDATAALNNPTIWDNLDDDEVAQRVSQLLGLQSVGRSDLMGRVYGNQLDDALGMFLNQYNAASRGSDTAPDARFMGFLRNNPEMRRTLGLR